MVGSSREESTEASGRLPCWPLARSYRMNGGGHQAPRTIAGRPFAQVVWDFFAAHPLPG